MFGSLKLFLDVKAGRLRFGQCFIWTKTRLEAGEEMRCTGHSCHNWSLPS